MGLRDTRLKTCRDKDEFLCKDKDSEIGVTTSERNVWYARRDLTWYDWLRLLLFSIQANHEHHHHGGVHCGRVIDEMQQI